MEPLHQPRRARAQLRGQGGEDLEPGRGDDRAQPQLGGRPGQAGQEQGLRLVGGHAGQTGPIAIDQADAAVRPALGEDRDAGGAQGVDVAVDGPDRDLELVGQLSRGQAAAGLEDQQQVDQSTGTHRGSIRRCMTGRVMYDGPASRAARVLRAIAGCSRPRGRAGTARCRRSGRRRPADAARRPSTRAAPRRSASSPRSRPPRRGGCGAVAPRPRGRRPGGAPRGAGRRSRAGRPTPPDTGPEM